MTEEQTANDIGRNDTKPTEKRTYERSSIEFPYNDLDDAIAVAKAVHENAGVSCSLDQLAAYLSQSMTSGAFRGRVANAGTFRLTDNASGEVTLTELGRRIVDPNLEKAARVESFLEVPLYRAIHERYLDYTLPPASALEREMVSMGVASKQTGKARQAFMRSARQAGFFAHGEDRLVKPALTERPTTRPIEKTSATAGGHPAVFGGGGAGGGEPPSNLDPIIQGLINRLPPSGASWPKEKRKLWLEILESSFELVYVDQTSSEAGQSTPPASNEENHDGQY